jgi:hypothetical protein
MNFLTEPFLGLVIELILSVNTTGFKLFRGDVFGRLAYLVANTAMVMATCALIIIS